MGCSHIPSITYRQFSGHLHNQSIAKRIPFDGMFELTFRCNLNCIHCYCSQSSEKELNTSEVVNIIDQLADCGCLWLLLTGGEPLLREDFTDIYTYAKKKGMLVTVFTNGTLINEKIADLFKSFPPFLIEISLYGASEKTYQAITQVKGTYSKTLSGIELLLKRKIPLRLKTMAMKANYNEISSMQEFAKERGLDFRIDPHIHPRLNGSLSPCDVRLSARGVVALDLADQRRVEKYQQAYQEYSISPNEKFLYNCAAGTDNFIINPYGYLQLCQIVTEPAFDLRKESFLEGWQEFIPKLKAMPRKENNTCGACRIKPLCGACPAWANLECGNYEKPIEYLCEIAKIREEEFGLKPKIKRRQGDEAKV